MTVPATAEERDKGSVYAGAMQTDAPSPEKGDTFKWDDLEEGNSWSKSGALEGRYIVLHEKKGELESWRVNSMNNDTEELLHH